MTKIELEQAGYKRYDPASWENCATDLYEKQVKDARGVRYAIQVTIRDYSTMGAKFINTDTSVQFNINDNDDTLIEVNYYGDNLERMEKFYEDLWNQKWFKYYEENGRYDV